MRVSMKRSIILGFMSLAFSSCVSLKKYDELFLQKEKSFIKTKKAEEKLNTLKTYHQYLLDSLNQSL
jgi:hypothetical protein